MQDDDKRTHLPIQDLIDLDEPEDVCPPAEPSGGEVDPPSWAGDEPMFIDVEGKIHVRGGPWFSSRVVGSVRGTDAEAVIGGLVERFQELEDRFKVLRREVRGSRNKARSLKSVHSFIRWVEGAEAVGDFGDLLTRAHALADGLQSEVAGSRSTRRSLVERAEELAQSDQWRSTGQAMEDLMDAWKRAGSAGGHEDEELWQRFRAARKAFFDRRSHHSSELRRQRGAARKAKEALITRAEEMAQSRDWEATSEAMQILMDEWKGAGSAGRKQDDELWERFRAARDPFFTARREHFAKQRRATSRPPTGRGRREERRGPQPGRRRTGGSAPLSASLAEMVGPLRDLYPASRDGEAEDDPARRTKKKRDRK